MQPPRAWRDLPPDLSRDERLLVLHRHAAHIARAAAEMRDPDDFIVEAVVIVARQIAEDDVYPADAVRVLLREIHRLRLH